MTPETLNVLDAVATLDDLPEKNLRRGQVGTIVERLDDNTFEVEFSDDDGRTYAFAALHADELLPLKYAPNSPEPQHA